MTEKEIAELRRRFRADKSNISRVYGCYVTARGEILSEFDQSVALMGQEESEMLLTTLRKTLSGQVGKNLLDIEFTTARPWTHLRPARITFQSEESTITGRRAISGSPAIRFRKVVISDAASSKPSSIFISRS